MRKKLYTTAGFALVAVLGLSACGEASDTGANEAETNDSDTETEDSTANDDKKDLTVAIFNGWDHVEAASYLWKHILEEEYDYTVDLQFADPGPVFTGVAQGDYDIAFEGNLPDVHADYIETYGDDLYIFSPWYEEVWITVAVNADAPIDSLTELADHAADFDNRIVGIEEGAGQTMLTRDEVMPHYGLDENMELMTSSTPAMLSELDRALQAGENVAVSLWHPHWAYDAFDIKDLEDPDEVLGGDESNIHAIASLNFPEEFPQLTEWIEDWTMDADLIGSLMNDMFNEPVSEDLEAIVADWIAQNQDYVDSMTQ